MTLATLLALILATGGIAVGQAPGNSGSTPGSSGLSQVYLPLIGQNTSFPPTSDMVLVPAGTFRMGCDPAQNGGYECYSDELPLHTVYLDAYYIDRTEGDERAVRPVRGGWRVYGAGT